LQIEEYLISYEVEDLVFQTKQLSLNHITTLIKEAILMTLDKKEGKRRLIKQLLVVLYTDACKSKGPFVDAIMEVFNCLEDLTLDIPLAPKLFGGLIREGIEIGFLPNDILQSPTMTQKQELTKVLLNSIQSGWSYDQTLCRTK